MPAVLGPQQYVVAHWAHVKGRGTHGFRMTAGRGLQGKVPSAEIDMFRSIAGPSCVRALAYAHARRPTYRVGWGLVRLLPLTDAPPNSLWASSEGEIVDGETLQSIPLTEIYDHHWILLNNVHKNRLCKGIEYVFGVGAESRNTPFGFPAGYGYHVPEGTEWGANIHLLRTEGLEGEDPYLAVKHCNECFYAPGKGDACNRQSNGTFQCCGDSCATGKTGKQSCKCPTAKGVSTERKGYKLKYTLNYTTGCDLEPVDSTAPSPARYTRPSLDVEDGGPHSFLACARCQVAARLGHSDCPSLKQNGAKVKVAHNFE